MADHQTNGDAAHVDTANETEHDKITNSPLLTSHRISNGSLDNVNLDEDGEGAEANPISPSLKGGLLGLPSYIHS